MTALANNVTLAVLARIAMLAATACLPIVGWLLVRSIDTLDDVHSRVISLQATSSATMVTVADHEARIRDLERRRN